MNAAAGVDLARGNEVLAVDGEPVGDILADLYPLFPVDGDTDFVKEPSVSNFGEFVGPAFEHFYPFLREVTDEVVLTVRKGKRGRRTVTANRLTFTEYSALTGEGRFSSNFADAVRFEPLGDDAAYLAVDTFINYRQPVDPDTIYAPNFERMKNQGRSRLIVDLRQNGGGSSDAAWGLVRWIAGKPVKGPVAVWTRMNGIDDALKPYLETWDPAVLEPAPAWFTPLDNGYFELAPVVSGVSDGPLQPKEGGFDGELVVLTGTNTASSVTHLLATLKGEDRGTYIGEPTGGAPTGATAGVILFLDLPESGIRVRVPLFRTVIPYPEKFNSRLGILPDIHVPQSRKSFFAGTDPALDAAKADVRGEGPGFEANINIPLPPGAGHGAYMETVDRVILPALECFDPDLVLVSNGVDANATDPLGRMMCHAGTFRAMSDAIVSASDRLCEGRLVVCHEGGYSTQLALWCILAVLEGLAKTPERPLDGMSLWAAANGGQNTTSEQSAIIEAAAALVDDIPDNR